MLPRAPNLSFAHLFGGGTVVADRKEHLLVAGSLDLESYLDLDHVLVTTRRHGGRCPAARRLSTVHRGTLPALLLASSLSLGLVICSIHAPR